MGNEADGSQINAEPSTVRADPGRIDGEGKVQCFDVLRFDGVRAPPVHVFAYDRFGEGVDRFSIHRNCDPDGAPVVKRSRVQSIVQKQIAIREIAGDELEMSMIQRPLEPPAVACIEDAVRDAEGRIGMVCGHKADLDNRVGSGGHNELPGRSVGLGPARASAEQHGGAEENTDMHRDEFIIEPVPGQPMPDSVASSNNVGALSRNAIQADVYRMRVALHTTFAASRKEPLAAMMDRVHQAFLDAQLGEPVIGFNFGDSPMTGGVSSVDRVLKRNPDLERFVTTAVPMPMIPGARRITNQAMLAGADGRVAYTQLQTIAAGVPRSFPFQSVAFHFHSPVFGNLAVMSCGVLLSDNWWANGRTRSLSALTVVEADAGSKKLPPLPGPVAAVLAACGKIKRTVQVPLPGEAQTGSAPAVRTPEGYLVASANPEAARAVQAIVVEYRTNLKQVMERAALPHELPGLRDQQLRDLALGVTAGPKKPVLERVFKPMGYTCRGESGTFTLQRRTPGNLTVQLHLDVGTWGHSVIAMFRVWGLGFKATLLLPVSVTEPAGAQYPIGDEERWRKIVENLGALVAELDRSFVPAIEAAAGPSPEWYQPDSRF